jgi:hypothetical protein
LLLLSKICLVDPNEKIRSDSEELMSQSRTLVSSLSGLRLPAAALLASVAAFAPACSGDGGNPAAPGTIPGVASERANAVPAATTGVSTAGGSQQKYDVCHRTSGTNEFVLIPVADHAIDMHIAHGDARPGSAVPGQPGMVLSPNCTAVSTSPVVITFDGLSKNGSAFTRYTQDGFTVTPVSGRWVALTTYGKPLPSIIFTRTASQPTISAAVMITAGGAGFRFSSVDLYSSITTIPWVFTGRLNAAEVFSAGGEEGNTFGDFVTVANPNASDTIDALVITLSNPETPCCDNPVGLDNIAVTYQP